MERKITIEENCRYREDYQIKMLRENHVEGILDVRGRGIDDRSCYDYTVSGKVSMKALYEKNNISGIEIKSFLNKLMKTIAEVERHLLNIHCILLEPEYIFCDDGEFYFCYYPLAKTALWEEFHRLTEYFVKQADYHDKECVHMVGYLHKETMSENYSLEMLVHECIKEDPGSEEIETEDKTDELSGNFGTVNYNWGLEQERGSALLRETDNLWLPVKKFLNRHRKPKWGDWDGLYIEEEEL